MKILDYYVEGQGYSKCSKCQWIFVWMISSEPQNILLPNLIWCFSIMSQSVMQKKKLFAVFKVKRSQWGLIWWKYDSFYCIFWTFDSSATKLGLMMHHHKLECLVKNILLLHSWSRSLWRVKMSMFVQMISSKLLNILWPNLVLCCIIMSQSVMQKDWVPIFKVKVTARAHMIKTWQFLNIF